MVVRPLAIVALDVPSWEGAAAIVDELDGSCRFYKVGLELFTAEGPSVVRRLRERECDVFLDLKFHDIPNTVQGAVRSAAMLGARLVTVHAGGGGEMLRAAAAGATEASTECGVLAVSVLTSLDGAGLAEAWGRDPVGTSVPNEVSRLARLAAAAGVHGIVCSGGEAARVRAEHGPGLAILVAGIRFAGGAAHDQSRVVTPEAAIAAGASYLVLGRAITGAASPRAAMDAVHAAIGATAVAEGPRQA